MGIVMSLILSTQTHQVDQLIDGHHHVTYTVNTDAPGLHDDCETYCVTPPPDFLSNSLETSLLFMIFMCYLSCTILSNIVIVFDCAAVTLENVDLMNSLASIKRRVKVL